MYTLKIFYILKELYRLTNWKLSRHPKDGMTSYVPWLPGLCIWPVSESQIATTRPVALSPVAVAVAVAEVETLKTSSAS